MHTHTRGVCISELHAWAMPRHATRPLHRVHRGVREEGESPSGEIVRTRRYNQADECERASGTTKHKTRWSEKSECLAGAPSVK